MGARRWIIDDQTYAHFITFSVVRRRWLLDHDHPKRIVLGVLNEVLAEQQATCIGFVVMPDHVHAMVWFPSPGRLSPFMHGWKRKSSFHIRAWYRSQNARYFQGFGEGERFWQPKYHSFEIYETAKIEEKLQYMHENPMRAGLVAHATDWKWSSAGWYARRQSVGVPIGWVE